MKYNPDKHYRQSIRFKGHDYSIACAYFITICTHHRECLFGDVVNGVMELNEFGQLVAEEWNRSSNIRQEIQLDEWIVMPNHFHGIVFVEPVECQNSDDCTTNYPVGANGRSPLNYGRSSLHSGNSTNVIPPMKQRSISSLIACRIQISNNQTNQHQPQYT
ncbi:transposase [Nostoc cycadae]|uniref:transposase n=1 Tax=Nostoc cycadae TaxID=246795 RepID=UPI001FE43753|nr:transposase [Nostoc cycadae]